MRVQNFRELCILSKKERLKMLVCINLKPNISLIIKNPKAALQRRNLLRLQMADRQARRMGRQLFGIVRKISVFNENLCLLFFTHLY